MAEKDKVDFALGERRRRYFAYTLMAALLVCLIVSDTTVRGQFQTRGLLISDTVQSSLMKTVSHLSLQAGEAEEKGHFVEAIRANRAILAVFRDERAAEHLALDLIKVNQPSGACETYKQIIDGRYGPLSPSRHSQELLMRYADACERSGRFQAAKEARSKVVALSPNPIPENLWTARQARTDRQEPLSGSSPSENSLSRKGWTQGNTY